MIYNAIKEMLDSYYKVYIGRSLSMKDPLHGPFSAGTSYYKIL